MHKNGPWGPTKAVAPVTGTTLRATGPICTGDLSTVNAIDTQLRDLINLGLTQWHMKV